MSDQQLPPRPRKIPPHILRRRRIVAVIILLIILALIGWGIWALIGLFTSDDEAAPAPVPTVTEAVSPSPSPTGADEEDEDDETELAKDRKSTRLNSSHVAISYAVVRFREKK